MVSVYLFKMLGEIWCQFFNFARKRAELTVGYGLVHCWSATVGHGVSWTEMTE
jgi:hypothetical protein